jgi:endonuclease YncB( thermonuclease family)
LHDLRCGCARKGCSGQWHIDGDTIEVVRNNRAERIRLNGIDYPEKGQAFGKRAKQARRQLFHWWLS